MQRRSHVGIVVWCWIVCVGANTQWNIKVFKGDTVQGFPLVIGLPSYESFVLAISAKDGIMAEDELSRQLIRWGHAPMLSVVSRGGLNSSSVAALSLATVDIHEEEGYWTVPFSSGSYGVIELLVAGIGVPVDDTRVFVVVDALERKDGTLGIGSSRTPPSNMTELQVIVTPGIAPASLALVSDGLLYSSSFFETATWRQLPSPSDPCPSTQGFMDAAVVPSGVLVVHFGRLMLYSKDVSLLLPDCVRGVSSVLPLGREDLVATAWSSTKVWLHSPSSDWSICGQVENPLQVVLAFPDSFYSTRCIVLVRNGTQSKMMILSSTDTPRVTVTFPSHVGAPPKTARGTQPHGERKMRPMQQSVSAVPLGWTDKECTKVVLDIHAGAVVGGGLRDLLLWGNGIVYSSSGESAYLLWAWENDRVKHAVLSPAGWWVALTHARQLWMGQLASPLVALVGSSGWSGDVFPFFDAGDVLWQVDLQMLSRTKVKGLQSALDQLTQDIKCPYSSLLFNGSHAAPYTRQIIHTNTEYEELPSAVYLGYGTSYAFDIVLRPRATEPEILQDLQVGVLYPYKDALVVHVEREESLSLHQVVYHIVVSDVGGVERMRVPPGTNLFSSTLRILVDGSYWSCQEQRHEELVDTVLMHSLQVHVGCAPGHHLVFDPEASQTGSRAMALQGCDTEKDPSNVYCVHFDNEFYPVYQLVDEYADAREVYQGKYQLSVIGAGPTLDDIHYFDEEEIIMYNFMGASSIWTILSDDGEAFFEQERGLLWLCSPFSPCSEVWPIGFNQPEYYFVFYATTQEFGEASLCRFENTMILRVHGISMTFGMTFMIIGGVILASMALVGLWYLYVRFRRPWLLSLSKQRTKKKKKKE